MRHTLTRPSELSHHFRPTLERSQEDFIVFEAPVVNNPHAKVATHKKEENCEKRSAKGVNNVVDKESQVLVQLKVKLMCVNIYKHMHQMQCTHHTLQTKMYFVECDRDVCLFS